MKVDLKVFIQEKTNINLQEIYSNLVFDYETSCWNWQRDKCPKGYGTVRFEGKRLKVYRVVYQDTFGPIPEGLHIDHLCRNPSCCNPIHLEPVTPKENVRRGLSTKLSEQQVIEIRLLVSTNKHTFQEIGKMFGITDRYVATIARGQHYSDVGGPILDGRKGGKLTEHEAYAIKYSSIELSNAELSRTYNVSQATVSLIRNGKLWSNL